MMLHFHEDVISKGGRSARAYGSISPYKMIKKRSHAPQMRVIALSLFAYFHAYIGAPTIRKDKKIMIKEPFCRSAGVD